MRLQKIKKHFARSTYLGLFAFLVIWGSVFFSPAYRLAKKMLDETPVEEIAGKRSFFVLTSFDIKYGDATNSRIIFYRWGSKKNGNLKVLLFKKSGNFKIEQVFFDEEKVLVSATS